MYRRALSSLRIRSISRLPLRNRLHFEVLEARHMLAATLWVDPNATATGTIFSTIQAAVAAAKSGDTIKVVAGTYEESVDVTKTLTIVGSQVRIGGEPIGPSIIKTSSPAIGFMLEANNITVKGFTIEQESNGITTNADFSGFNITNNILLDNVVDVHLQTPLVMSTKGTTISGNKFADDSTGLSTQQAILIDQAGARNVVVSSNSFSLAQVATVVQIEASNLCSNIQILKNSILDDISGGTYGILADNLTNSKIAGNRIQTDFTAIHLAGAVTKTTIANNTLDGFGRASADGIDVFPDTFSADPGNSINDNVIYSFKEGIWLDGAEQDTVSNNMVWGCTDNGVLIADGSTSNTCSANSITQCSVGLLLIGNSNTISKNSIVDNSGFGISAADSSQNMIFGNTVSNDGVGISFGNGPITSTMNTIRGNIVNDNNICGIKLDTASANVVSGNHLNKDQQGFDLTGDTDHNTVTWNTVTNSFGDGIVVESGSLSNTISKNTVNQNLNGLVVNGDGDTVIGNIANHNLFQGFGVTGNNNMIKSNTAKDNGAVGFEIDGDTNSVSANSAKDNEGDGLLLITTSSKISGNTANNNADNGIELVSSSSNNTVTSNTAMGNGKGPNNGFDLLDDSVGGGTDSTNNTWHKNDAKTANPVGLLKA